MGCKINFDRLFIFSDRNKIYFNEEFDSGINLIYGPNTSGKSTLIQSLLYTFGINDGKEYLFDILSNEVIFRLDCTLFNADKKEKIVFIRDEGTLYIKKGELPIQVFSGINSDNSNEHIKLKDYLHQQFGFSLYLESKEEYNPAPIETIFLPYYVSQAVGWVYLRKSFSNLDFYRNFKDDYLDYYLGIENAIDRKKKKEIDNKLIAVQKEISFLSEMEKGDTSLQVTKIADEKFTLESITYIETYKKLQDDIIKNEKEYIIACNELSYLNERKSILSRIKRNQQSQNIETGNCPMCSQVLPYNPEAYYIYSQETNDTDAQLIDIKAKIKDKQSIVNSLNRKIKEQKSEVSKNYGILKLYETQELSFDTWIDNKANLQLNENILTKIGKLTIDLNTQKDLLKDYKTEDEVIFERSKKSASFAQLFNSYLLDLDVKPLIDDRFSALYKISAFPSQGVELHKTVMAYHFALNNLIKFTPSIHRFPFLLDAIFKEDIDEANRDLILKFIAKHRPNDTQLFLTISEIKNTEIHIANYQKDFFNNSAKLIRIGDGIAKRTLLKNYSNEHEEYVLETFNIINKSMN